MLKIECAVKWLLLRWLQFGRKGRKKGYFHSTGHGGMTGGGDTGLRAGPPPVDGGKKARSRCLALHVLLCTIDLLLFSFGSLPAFYLFALQIILGHWICTHSASSLMPDRVPSSCARCIPTGRTPNDGRSLIFRSSLSLSWLRNSRSFPVASPRSLVKRTILPCFWPFVIPSR